MLFNIPGQKFTYHQVPTRKFDNRVQMTTSMNKRLDQMCQTLIDEPLTFCQSFINVLNSSMQSQTHLLARLFSDHILSGVFD